MGDCAKWMLSYSNGTIIRVTHVEMTRELVEEYVTDCDDPTQGQWVRETKGPVRISAIVEGTE